MVRQRATILDELIIRAALKQTWQDSQPGVTGGHEEGGFILRDTEGNLSIARWPVGTQSNIIVPPHPNCKITGSEIVATFHTHPNTGNDYLQEPSETDKRAVRDDPNLKGEFYEGEFVISQERIYFIAPDGQTSEIGVTSEIFGEE